MSKVTKQSLLAIFTILIGGGLLAWAGNQGSSQWHGYSVFGLCVALAFLINWVAYIPAQLASTEHYFDLTGSLTYLATLAVAVVGSGGSHWRGQLLVLLVAWWATRLGTFLYQRTKAAGGDGRFVKFKQNFVNFLMVWTLQALWVLLTVGAALAAITSTEPGAFGWMTLIGLVLFSAGFVIEVEADTQKSAFKADAANEGLFITQGLWAWSRHPNYFGEILLWLGIAFIAVPALQGWQLVTLVSPVFVFLLLTRISGIPLLESRGNKRWGADPEYQAYKARTPALFPRPPRADSIAGAAID